MTLSDWSACRSIAKHGVAPLLERVANEHGIKVGRLLSRTQERHVTAARFHLWAELRTALGMSSRSIATALGFDRKAVDRGIDVHLNRQPRIRRTA